VPAPEPAPAPALDFGADDGSDDLVNLRCTVGFATHAIEFASCMPAHITIVFSCLQEAEGWEDDLDDDLDLSE
jgi:hypothetical protein